MASKQGKKRETEGKGGEGEREQGNFPCSLEGNKGNTRGGDSEGRKIKLTFYIFAHVFIVV